jgi:beta-glucosidase
LYVAPQNPSLTRPPKELKAFAKVWLDPGDTTTVTLELGDRAFSYWQPATDAPAPGRTGPPIPSAEPGPAPDPGWRIDSGAYDLHIGRSSAAIAHVTTMEVTT